ncbi:MAG: PspC domain-containing protein [Sphingobacteriaceae bacterium]|nr:MAG: PspC domain-containing protein [Sphingobacteriaceae bacterium]
MEKKLYRDEQHKKVGGVCAGLADYFGIDVSIIRVIFLVTLVVHGTGAVIYVILWAVLPVKPVFFKDPFTDYRVPPQQPYGDATPPNFTMPNSGQTGNPFEGVPQKKSTNAGVAGGMILIVLGAVFLLNNFNLIPHISFHMLWPIILVVIGIVFIFSGSKKQPWEKKDWHKTEAEATEEKKEESNNDNPTTT